MAGRGPAPKPSHLRQRKNKRPGSAMLEAPAVGLEVPPIPNPDGREFHPLTIAAWERAWGSEMAGQWLATDADGLGRLALLWDAFYKEPKPQLAAEIRLQEQRFGLSPLDRSRLQWEVSRAEEAEKKQQPPARRTGTHDPRRALMAVVK